MSQPAPLPAFSPTASTMPSRPKRSLRTKLICWVAVMVALPALICAVAFNLIGQGLLMENHDRDGQMLTQTIAASMRGRLSGSWSRREGDLIDSLSRDKKIAFAIVSASDGKPLHVGVFNAKEFEAYHAARRGQDQSRVLDGSQAESTEISGRLAIHQVLVTHNADTAAKDKGKVAPQVEGAVTLGIMRPDIQKSLMMFHVVQVSTVAGVMIFFIPMVWILLRRWMQPLSDLVVATRKLAAGEPLPPLPVHNLDELGYLACSFNDMAGRLTAGRRALVDANTELEVRVRRRTAELQETMEKLDKLASTDALTGLANRRFFNEQAERLFEITKQTGRELCCLLIDLDGFKQVNDKLGHQAGDVLLTLAGKVLNTFKRDDDVAARLGGDEFALLMPRMEVESAAETGRRLLEAFCSQVLEVVPAGEDLPRVSMSIGLASRMMHRPATFDDLLRQADDAMYQSKKAGKAQLTIHANADQAGTPAA